MDCNEIEIDETIVTPGQGLTDDLSFMRGHGTFLANQHLTSSVVGRVVRLNKLISVKPLKSRFNGEIGDVVIGRIKELSTKRWKVEINGRQDAILLLSSINLPGGIQRRKNETDEMEMRSFFEKGDLLSAEVHAFFNDGASSLQTRNIKYGKLRNGSLIIVPSTLVKRAKSHFITLANNVDIILGLNGYIWCAKHVYTSPAIINQPGGLYSNKNEIITIDEREAIARVCNIISALANSNTIIEESLIAEMLSNSINFTAIEILDPKIQAKLLSLSINK